MSFRPTAATTTQKRRRIFTAASILLLASSSTSFQNNIIYTSNAFSSTSNLKANNRISLLLKQPTPLYMAPPQHTVPNGKSGTKKTTDETVLNKDEFELHVGRALDTLRNDYPMILTKNPDFSIYDNDVECIDPNGVKVHGLRNYKTAFNLLHAITKILYCPSKSTMNLRMCYDKARQNIRIHWNVEAVPREIFGIKPSYFDGISVYELNKVSGNITQHRIERLLYNDRPVLLPKEGLIAALRQEHAVTVPSFIQQKEKNTILKFDKSFNRGNNPVKSLFALEANNEQTMDGSAANMNNDIDWEALESKNKSRKKFGLKPLTPEEFVDLQAQVKLLDEEQRAKQSALSSSQTAKPPKAPNMFDKIFGNVLLKDTCESNFDCERPEVCCDFGFQKRCCASGTPVGAQPQYATVPVPVNIQDPRNF